MERKGNYEVRGIRGIRRKGIERKMKGRRKGRKDRVKLKQKIKDREEKGEEWKEK